jgi:hypothetical protein
MPYQVPSSLDTLYAVSHTVSDLVLRTRGSHPASRTLWRTVDSTRIRVDALGGNLLVTEPNHPSLDKFLMEFV